MNPYSTCLGTNNFGMFSQFNPFGFNPSVFNPYASNVGPFGSIPSTPFSTPTSIFNNVPAGFPGMNFPGFSPVGANFGVSSHFAPTLPGFSNTLPFGSTPFAGSVPSFNPYFSNTVNPFFANSPINPFFMGVPSLWNSPVSGMPMSTFGFPGVVPTSTFVNPVSGVPMTQVQNVQGVTPGVRLSGAPTSPVGVSVPFNGMPTPNFNTVPVNGMPVNTINSVPVNGVPTFVNPYAVTPWNTPVNTLVQTPWGVVPSSFLSPVPTPNFGWMNSPVSGVYGSPFMGVSPTGQPVMQGSGVINPTLCREAA